MNFTTAIMRITDLLLLTFSPVQSSLSKIRSMMGAMGDNNFNLFKKINFGIAVRPIFILWSILFSLNLFAQKTTNQDGDWQTNSTWNGSQPGITNLGPNQDIRVNHFVTAGEYGSEISMTFAANKEDDDFIINDTLIIYGDLTMANKSMDLVINGALIITGNFNCNNKLNLDADGVLVIFGNFNKTGSDGDFTGSGEVYATNYTGNASAFVPGPASGGTEQDITTDLAADNTACGGCLADILAFYNNNGATPLPITLKNFGAQPFNSTIGLNWTTLTEENFDFFEIQRAAAADGIFSVIATVEGNGFSKEEINYSWSDENPRIGLNYYRLESVDYDGYRETFPSVALIYEPQNRQVSITPNPVALNSQIKLNNTFGESFSMKVLSLDGSAVLDFEGEANMISLPASLKSGIYLAVFEVNGLKKTQKLIIR